MKKHTVPSCYYYCTTIINAQDYNILTAQRKIMKLCTNNYNETVNTTKSLHKPASQTEDTRPTDVVHHQDTREC